jgi:hypothetical protein
MRIKKNTFLIELVLVFTLFMIAISYLVDGLNYLRYFSLIPLVFLIRRKIKKGYLYSTLKLFLVFLFFGFFVTAFSFNFSLRQIAESTLIILPIIYVIFFDNIKKISYRHIKIFFYITLLFMIMDNFM